MIDEEEGGEHPPPRNRSGCAVNFKLMNNAQTQHSSPAVCHWEAGQICSLCPSALVSSTLYSLKRLSIPELTPECPLCLHRHKVAHGLTVTRVGSEQ